MHQPLLTGRPLAAADAELDRFDEALTLAREALALARTQGNERMVPELRARLALYEQR